MAVIPRIRSTWFRRRDSLCPSNTPPRTARRYRFTRPPLSKRVENHERQYAGLVCISDLNQPVAASGRVLRLRNDQRHGKSVIPFAAHGLDDGGAYAWFGGEQFIETSRPLHSVIVAGGR